jgi:DNA-binding CsgD family transcriptional regulator
VASPFKTANDETVLTDKEITILRLMCEEKSTREIAEAVELSPRTIEAIRDKLKVKTGTKSTAGLIMFAVKNNLLDQES